MTEHTEPVNVSPQPDLERPPVARDIVEEHAEEAAFLWVLRDQALTSPHYTLDDLGELEERIEAHLDGLRIAEAAGWDVVVEQLASEESGEVFSAAVLALESGAPDRFQVVADVVAAAPETARGMISAFGWVHEEFAVVRLGELLGAADPVLRSVGIVGSVAHRKDPGIALQTAFESESPDLRRRGFAAAGRLGRSSLIGAMAPGLNDADQGCRYAAAWASALLGDAAGLRTLQLIAAEEGSYREQSAAFAARLLEPNVALAWQRSLANDSSAGRVAVVSAGAIGDPVVIPWLIEQMARPELARLAGEAFGMIVGVDLIEADLVGPAPQVGRSAGPTDEPDDADVAMDPDENLPWPAASRVAEAWGTMHKAFTSRVRYLLGTPIAPESVRQVLRSGRQRERIAAAVLDHAFGARPLFDTRARADVQRERLA